MQNHETDMGTQKRQELAYVVRKSSRRRDRLKLKLDWETDLHGGLLSCGYVTVGRHGNVASLYTWTKRRKIETYPLPKFSAVEIALLNPRFEKVANRICEELIKRGYEADITRNPMYMSRPDSSRFINIYNWRKK